jgi:O-6-methylguanine DNA methyltransferase
VTFSDQVLKVVRGIKKGQTLTYQQVAARAGNPRAYRAVGNILNKNYNPQIPCHRVIRSNGQTGGYNRGAKAKIAKLKSEGVKIN